MDDLEHILEYINPPPLSQIQVLIHGKDVLEAGLDSYQKYIYHMYESRVPPTVYEDFSRGYEELLQIPLQPLKDNLDNSTYEVRGAVNVLLYCTV